MKYSAAINPSNYTSSYSREYISLSPKITASATYTEGFGLNSPKPAVTKGFTLSRSAVGETAGSNRGQKADNPLIMTSKSRTTGNIKVYTPTMMLMENPTPNSRKGEILGVNTQVQRGKAEKKSSSASKLKSDSYRTMSSTPKNAGGSSRAADSVRLTNETGAQQKWKKLEISTDYNTNAKNSYATKAQTTKHTDIDESGLSRSYVPSAQTIQALQKSLQAKSMNTAGLGSPNNQAADIKFDQKFRSNRPHSSSSAKNRDRSLPADNSTKENVKINNFFASEKESYGARTPSKGGKTPSSAKKSNSTIINEEDLTQSVVGNKKLHNSTNFDLRNTWQTSGNDSLRKEKRPLSAKKATRDLSKDDAERSNAKVEKSVPQKASLQAFVTKVNKGDMFGGMKKYSDNKRENSARKPQQKPYLNLDDNRSKPIRAVDLDLKGPRTTTSAESKTFTVNLGKSQANAAPTQTMPPKNSKMTKSNGTPIKESKSLSNDSIVRVTRPGAEKEPFIYYMTNMARAHRWEGEADYFVQIYQDHFIQSYQALTFCKNVKVPEFSQIAQKRIDLPRRESHKDKKTIVFDMDETLIHCNESLDMPADVILPIVFPNGEVVEAGVNIRPYAVEILKELSQYYEVIVFTASHSCYANVVLDYLDPEGEYIHHRLFRESCVVTEEGVHIKDLRVIGNRNIQDVILVDNAAYSFGFQIENGIPIIPFYDNKTDQELRRLIPYLKFLSTVKDPREINKQTFRMHLYSNHESAENALVKLIFQE